MSTFAQRRALVAGMFHGASRPQDQVQLRGANADPARQSLVRVIPVPNKMAADKGDADAQCKYGQCLEKGEGVSQNLIEAVRYYKMAADQGHAEAQARYGHCLEKGQGVSQDLSAAARYYKLSADQGYARAQFMYGWCLEKGRGVSRDSGAATRYYKLSADQGYARAQDKYGWCLAKGRGVSRDLSAAARYFKLSADQGYAGAQFSYGWRLARGEGVLQDLSEAARYYKMAADQGYARAQYKYGLCLERGEGVLRDLSAAVRYYKMAADQGYAHAQFSYGLCLLFGEGVSQDWSAAARYCKLSADQGYASAQLVYGLCLESGQGVSRDLSEAARYYKMAVDQGDSDALVRWNNLVDADGNLRESVHDCSNEVKELLVRVHNARKRLRPLSDLIVDINRDLDGLGRDLISGCSGNIQLFRRKQDGKEIIGKFVLPDGEQRFEREISALSDLDHPCVVTFAGFTLPSSFTEYRFLIFTEYLSGGSLSDVLENPRGFPWFNSTGRSIVVVGIVLGMRYVHSRGIFHRDLKPGHVIIDKNHHAHLCDFGSVGCCSHKCTMTDRSYTSPYYSAPETCNENGDFNEKVDVYSFGIMLYEIATGQLALRHLNQQQIQTFISQGKRPDIPRSVLPFTRSLIQRCWSQDPVKRPSFEEIYDYLVGGNFRLFEDVNCLAVSRYGQSVCDSGLASA